VALEDVADERSALSDGLLLLTRDLLRLALAHQLLAVLLLVLAPLALQLL
jgi:hypothetical protein